MKKYAPPLFESALLHDIASAIEWRGKSIRYRGRLECSRSVEGPFERLNINFASPVYGYVWLSIWSDGKLWLALDSTGRSPPAVAFSLLSFAATSQNSTDSRYAGDLSRPLTTRRMFETFGLHSAKCGMDE